MAKKSKRDRHEMAEVPEMPVPPVPQNPYPPAQERWPNLAKIRNRALDVRADAQRTILELEAWRDELDATLAFLRAGKR